MGTCKYCGTPAGFLGTVHEGCRANHLAAIQSIPIRLESGLENPTPPTALYEQVQRQAARGYLKKDEYGRAAWKGFDALVSGGSRRRTPPSVGK